MKVLGREIIDGFGLKHADAVAPLSSWFHEAEEAEWKNPAELKQKYGTASIISSTRVIFNIKGNRYRLDAKINYSAQVIMVKRIGTHTEYDLWTF